MILLIVILALVVLAALAHRFIASRLIANLLPASFVCTSLVGYEYFILMPERTALGGLILPFIFMGVLAISLFVGMAMNLLKMWLWSRQT